MSTEMFGTQLASIRELFTNVTGANPTAFSDEGVTITARPEPANWPFTAMTIGFGTGLVVCVEASYLEWAREHTPTDAVRAQYIVAQLTAEGARRGEELHPTPPMLAWALSSRPPNLTPPAGYRVQRVDKAWMDEWQRRDQFTNALGLAVQMHRVFRNQFAQALFDEAGEPAAVAGVFDTAGLSEIGVDVAPKHRGNGLSAICVSAACLELLDTGKTPFYVCEVRNTRSQHAALASGFLPVGSVSIVMASGMGLADDN